MYKEEVLRVGAIELKSKCFVYKYMGYKNYCCKMQMELWPGGCMTIILVALERLRQQDHLSFGV